MTKLEADDQTVTWELFIYSCIIGIGKGVWLCGSLNKIQVHSIEMSHQKNIQLPSFACFIPKSGNQTLENQPR